MKHTDESYSQSVDILFRFHNLWNPPMSIDEFTKATLKVTDEHMKVLQKYLCVCKDGFIRVRSIALINDWYGRYTSMIKANWAALGIRT